MFLTNLADMSELFFKGTVDEIDVGKLREGMPARMRGVRKVYSTGRVEVTALKRVDLDVETNEYVAVVGPSGSGKSTLMNILGCLDTPSAGEYVLSGESVAGLDRNRLAKIASRVVQIRDGEIVEDLEAGVAS